MANTNRFRGLARGPIDHKSSSVINQISDGSIDMGSVVAVSATIDSREILPRVGEISSEGSSLVYGIAVGGDVDGIYGDGSASTDDKTRATNAAGQGVVIVTQGRCLARVTESVAIGDPLTQSVTAGVLKKALATEFVFAFALNGVDTIDTDMIAVDVQRGGIF